MAALGSFGAAMRELEPDEKDTFDFFGETFTVEGVIPTLLLIKCSAGMAGAIGGIESDAAMWDVLRCALTTPAAGPDGKPGRAQWERFYTLATEKNAGGESLAALVLNLMAAQGGKDLEKSPTSAGGSSPGSTNSNSSASDSPGSEPDAPA